MMKNVGDHKGKIGLTEDVSQRMAAVTEKVQQAELDFTKALPKDESLTEYLVF
jgi:hypothetical protein